MKRTKHAIHYMPAGHPAVDVPAGSPVEPGKPGPQDREPFYWVSPSVWPRGSIERHDATYYGVRVTESDIEEVAQ